MSLELGLMSEPELGHGGALMSARTHDFSKARLRPGHEVRRFEALEPGLYEVEGIGPLIEIGDCLRFSVRGAETVALDLTVENVRRQIIPPGGFVARARTVPFSEMTVQRGTSICDGCRSRLDIEVAVAHPEHLQAAVALRLQDFGWRTEGARHFCAAC